MKLTKALSIILTASLAVSSLTACGGGKADSGKTDLSVGLWPDETRPAELELLTKRREEFMAQNPDINIIPDTYAFDTKTFTMKAAANQLPNMFITYFTEVKQVAKNKTAADLTDFYKKYNLEDYYNENVLECCKGDDGKFYALPQSCYAQGLAINLKLFKEAGLVDENGMPEVPDTFEELAEFAKIIKDKTGKAGYVIPTTNNCGGWHFLNIAWAFGTEFEKQRDDGTWEATFDTEPTRKALQFIKDLKWKYDVLPSDTVLDNEGMKKQFATGNAAMMFGQPPMSELSVTYGMSKDDIFLTKIPKGEAGRFSQMGGGVIMFSKNTTPKQLDAAYKWMKFTGSFDQSLTEEQKASKEQEYKNNVEAGYIILEKEAFPLVNKKYENKDAVEIRKKYVNVDQAHYEQYYDFSDVTIRPEPAACAQELYSVLDRCIQEVLANENADIDAIIKEANNDFQVNHLDKM